MYPAIYEIMRHSFHTALLFILCLSAVAFSSCDEETTRLEAYAIEGIDVSRYQGKVAWSEVAFEGFRFAFIKATEGVAYSDPQFCDNWEGARAAGLKRGAYHFFLPDVAGEKQAANFINTVEMEYGDLPPVLDIEITGDLPKEIIVQRIKAWLYLVELEFSIRPIIYTHFKFYNKFIAGHFDEYPIWIAKYGNRPPPLGGSKRWTFWQYGNKGRIEGIRGPVDFNVFHGNYQDLEQLCLGPNALLSE